MGAKVNLLSRTAEMSEDAKLSSNLNNDMQRVYPSKDTLIFDRDGETVRWSSPREAGTQTGTMDTSRNQGGASSRTHKRKCVKKGTAILGSKKMRTGFKGHASNLKRKKGRTAAGEVPNWKQRRRVVTKQLRDFACHLRRGLKRAQKAIKHEKMALSPIWDDYSTSQLRTIGPGITRLLPHLL